jgi:hypothetical protein
VAPILKPPPELAGLQVSLSNTLTQIDAALDRGDRRAFRIWSGRYLSLSARLANLLVRLATAE